MEFNAEKYQSESEVGDSSFPDAGYYHVAVNSAEDGMTKSTGKPCMVIEYVAVREGIGLDKKTPTVGQSGHVIKKTYSFVSDKGEKETENCQKVLLRIALATGVLRPGEKKEVEASDFLGRELIIEVRSKKKTSQAGNEYEGAELAMFGYWSLGSSEVAFVPKDATTPGMQQLAKNGGATATKPQQTAGNGNGNGNGAKPSATPAAATATRGKYSDL